MGNLQKLRILSKDEVLKVHENSLKVLEDTGVIVHSQEVLNDKG
jgi:trimethylamine:corrinoid methyltransferase-like protein